MQDVVDIEVTPLSAACGAEIKGVDLTKPLSEAAVEAIKDAWGKHLVLVFRGQNVSQDDQLRFATYFGDLGLRKKAPEALRSRNEGTLQESNKDANKVLLVSNIKDADGKADRRVRRRRVLVPHRFRLHAAAVQVHLPLCARIAVDRRQHDVLQHVPGLRGGAGGAQGKAQGPKALHIHEYNRAKQAGSSGDISGIPHHYHPLFITHPDTGRKTLFVDRLMTTRIEGMEQAESDAILNQLYEIGERREFIFEHVWKLGDFLMWDNRCTIHARTDFPKEERRLLRRCTVEGEPLYE
jgi:taurine dioxygenase